MKKMNLLSKAEMRKVIGGDPGEPENPGPDGGGGTCAWHDGSHAICNLSKSDAQAFQRNVGGNWCCDSCPSGLC